MKPDPKQLRLAADIIEHNHPFEVRHTTSEKWHHSLGIKPAQAVLQDWHLRPVLATPPYPAKLHNPDNLTAEQVGVGYRLALKGEPMNLQIEQQEYWSQGKWTASGKVYTDTFDAHQNARCTYRLPLSVPWPDVPETKDPYAELKAAHAEGKVIQQVGHGSGEWYDCLPNIGWTRPPERYRIKPTESAKPEDPFQLPPPPPGMRWRREDGWQADDLPQGYRPYVQGETLQKGDEWKQYSDNKWQVVDSADTGIGWVPDTSHPFRTTRPLTFTHAGKTWTYHRPGDPMPCDGDRPVALLQCDDPDSFSELGVNATVQGREWAWDDDTLVGWRYAEPETKEVELGPEDVPPGSAIQGISSPAWHWIAVVSVHQIHVNLAGHCGDIGTDRPTWDQLKKHAKINRSLSRGQWNPDAWEPCKKTIPA